MFLLKKMPGQRNFSGDIVETLAEKRKARKERIDRNFRKRS